MFEDECCEFADEVDIADVEVGIDPSGERAQSFGVETGGLAAHRRNVSELFVCNSAPLRECLAQLLASSTTLAPLEQSAARSSELREQLGIELLRPKRQCLSTGMPDDGVAAKDPAQVRHVSV